MSVEPRIEPISAQDIGQILDLKWSVFAPYYSTRAECDEYTMASVDWSLSVKLLLEREIIGMYLLEEEPISNALQHEGITTLYEGLESYQSRRGLHGVTLAVDETFRGRGWGNRLKDYSASLGYDYWWAVAFKQLGNLRDWQKRARLVGESHELYLLLEDYVLPD